MCAESRYMTSELFRLQSEAPNGMYRIAVDKTLTQSPRSRPYLLTWHTRRSVHQADIVGKKTQNIQASLWKAAQ